MKKKAAPNPPKPYLPLLAVLLVSALVYARILGHGFVLIDDFEHIADNPHLKAPFLEGLKAFWTAPYTQLYIPVSYTIWLLVAKASLWLGTPGPGGLDPRFFHGASYLTHLGCVVTVYFFLLKLILADAAKQNPDRVAWAAAFGAALFALHPMQVEPIAWIVCLRDMLAFLFGMLALWRFVHFSRTRIRNQYFQATFLFVTALLCKPSAAIVPMLTFLVLAWLGGKPGKREALWLSPWLALGALDSLLSKQFQPDAWLTTLVPFPQRLVVAADSFFFYIAKLVLPIRQGLDYGRTPPVLLASSEVYYTWIGFLVPALLIWFYRKRWPWLAWGAAFSSLAILPVSGIVPFGHQEISTVADRYLYMPMLGIAAIGARIALYKSQALGALCAGILVALGAKTSLQLSVWANNRALFENSIQFNPKSSNSHDNLGRTLFDDKKIAEAMVEYQKAIELNPRNRSAQINLGTALSTLGKNEEMVAHYRSVIASGFESPKLSNNLAVGLVKLGKMDEALPQFEAALKQEPGYYDARLNYGIILFRMGKLKEAKPHLEIALQLNPAANNAAALLKKIQEAGL